MVTSRILFTAKQKDELWERWKNGQSVLAISRALERRNKTGVQRIVALNGGIAGGADSEEKHEPVSDIDTVLVDSLKALDPKRPIREADMTIRPRPAGLAFELLFERRHGPPLFRDLQDLLLNEWIARHLGEFFAFAQLVAILVGLACHRTIPWAQRG